jgi:hypothetical protein
MLQIPDGMYAVKKVTNDMELKQAIQNEGYQYSAGKGYYQVRKDELVQGYKGIILMDKM